MPAYLKLAIYSTDVPKLALLTFLYVVTGYFGLKLEPAGGFATLVWIPTGLSLAALFLFGSKLWPAVFLGAFLVNSLHSAPLTVALGIALGNTLEAVTGSYILKKYQLNIQISTIRDILVFVIFGAFLASLMSSTLGTLTLFASGLIAAGQIGSVWATWWTGDALGALVITPLIFAWYQQSLTTIVPKNQFQEFAIWIILFVVTSLLVFFSKFPLEVRTFFLPYLILPNIVWLILRFNRVITTTTIFAIAIMAVVGSSFGLGLFTHSDLTKSLLLSQIYTGVLTISILIFSAEVKARQDAEKEILRLNESLLERIDEEKRVNKLMMDHVKSTLPKKKTGPSRNGEIEVDVN